MERIFLDYNATTPAKPEVIAQMAKIMAGPVNPSSIHVQGRMARKIVEEARTKVMKLVNASEAYQLVFTASGTEANNLALKGFRPEIARLVSAVEHPSVMKACDAPTLIPVDKHGVVCLNSLEKLLQMVEGRALVSVMLANNETGVIQPIERIAEIVYRAKGYLHCDTVQAIGKIAVDIQKLNVDMLSLSAHKIGGGQGAGALIFKKNLPLEAIISGGGQESGFRAGTENVAAIAGFGMAAEMAAQNIAAATRISAIRDYMEYELSEVAEELEIFGSEVARLPNTSCISMPGIPSEIQLIHFDLEHISVSSGSACSSGKVSTSHVLQAMGVEKNKATSAIRISLGAETTVEQIEKFIDAWKKFYYRFQGKIQEQRAA